MPAENLGILQKLYVDLKLSTRDIEQITQSSWSKTSILEALKNIKSKRILIHLFKKGGNHGNIY